MEDEKRKELVPNYKGEYKVYEFGNQPYIKNIQKKIEGGEKDERMIVPKGHYLRFMLPCDADWTGEEENIKENEKEVVEEKGGKKKKK